ncbi:MAG: hypothetical protein WKF86_04980 [Acidimicrobiales bacterium]
MLIVDDALLLRVLALTAPEEFLDEARSGQVFTTGSWYYRLAKAVAQPKVAGALSTAMAALPPIGQERARAGLHSLPPIIGMIDLRTLVPTMAALNVDRPLNLLAAEATAAAVLLDAGLVVTTNVPLIEGAAVQLGLTYRVIGS